MIQQFTTSNLRRTNANIVLFYICHSLQLSAEVAALGKPFFLSGLNTGIARKGGWGQPFPKCFWSTILWTSIFGQNAKRGVG